MKKVTIAHTTSSLHYGHLLIGLSTKDPQTLSPLPKSLLFEPNTITLSPLPSPVQLYYDGSTLFYIFSSEHRIPLCSVHANEVWLVMELFGSTSSVTIIKSTISFNTSNIILLGSSSVGKTQFRKTLTNIDNCNDSNLFFISSVHTSGNGQWDNNVKLPITIVENSDLYEIISLNIIKQIKLTKKEDDTSEMLRNALRLSKKNANFDAINELNSQDLINLLPAKSRETINELLNKPNFLDDIPEVSELPSSKNWAKYKFWELKSNNLYLIVNQIIFLPEAIYILIINFNRDLDTPSSTEAQAELNSSEWTPLDQIHHYLSLIYTHPSNRIILTSENDTFLSSSTASSSQSSLASSISPKILLISTHRNSLHNEPITRDQMINEYFERIKNSISHYNYFNLVIPEYFSIDTINMSVDEPEIFSNIKVLLDKLLPGNKEIPWYYIQFENIIERLIRKGVYFGDINSIFELTKVHLPEVKTMDTFQKIISFHKEQGKLLLFSDSLIALDPIWFIERLYQLIDAKKCILRDEVINEIWSDHLEHKMLLLGCLERIDIICEIRPSIDLENPPDVASFESKVYLFPWLALPDMSEDLHKDIHNKNADDDDDSVKISLLNDKKCYFKFVLEFKYIPLGLFSKLAVRLSRWSWNQGCGRRPEIYHRYIRIAVDCDHDLILNLVMRKSRIWAIIVKVFDSPSDRYINTTSNICVKVRYLLEDQLEVIQNNYYRRILYILKVLCPCDLVCKKHFRTHCLHEDCVHFIMLNDCLNKKIVECDYRQVRTNFIQKFFPQSTHPIEETIYTVYNQYGWDNLFRVEPTWMRDAAKLLLTHNPGKDWLALAKRLGYNEKEISKLIEEVSPPLALIYDWYETNGRTRYCIDILISCLKMMSRDDVRRIIESDISSLGFAPPVFISYQWDSQEFVLKLRRKLELFGFPCWMDIGIIGGGDTLYAKIYEGISRCCVFICFLTPRYAASRLCAREVALADLLHKPIIPAMIEPTPWPPPGPMAVIMSSLTYIDLCDVGSHGGIGKRADMENRFIEILNQISRYMNGYIDGCIMNSNNMADIFLRKINTNHRFSLATLPSSYKENTSASDENEGPEVSTQLQDGETYTRRFDVESNENVSSDSISELSGVAQAQNRVSNCSICAIL